MTRIAPAWLPDPAVQAAMAALAPLRPLFVGGCVRDALMGRPGADVDICVAAPPEETMRRAAEAGLHAHPTGIDHGVVTLVAGGRPFEVASLRRDVETDGRRAVIAYTEAVAEDAARRDFTLNALYADASGAVLDPTGEGLADLAARRLRFVGEPRRRIGEDYLRILRFFRFHAQLGFAFGDPAALAACHAMAEGLARVSQERIGAEMLKLLAAPDPEPALAAMGPVLPLALPGAAPFTGLVAAERLEGEAPAPLRRLAALGAPGAARALRLSRAEGAALGAIRAAFCGRQSPAEAAWRHGAEAARDALLIRAAGGEPLPPGWRAEIARGASASMPLSAADLMEAGWRPGPALGAALKRAEVRWIEADFASGRTALLAAAGTPEDG
ncbi:MAG: CCA tRNA nucleotidyltransferase [Pikeienuella sp.]|uniref:CCA tRNA nucleotidyltransferase n=1 Tax=Pikeienuella sp. TaxID=2831957 RepID=UPI00391B0157